MVVGQMLLEFNPIRKTCDQELTVTYVLQQLLHNHGKCMYISVIVVVVNLHM
jgi:hypothetical protein